MTIDTSRIEAKELNAHIDPIGLLQLIGYEKSSPKISGGEIRDYCPLHKGDNQQSIAISQDKHTYICHNCAESGDLIDLYGKAKGLTFKDSIKELAEIYNLPIQYTYANKESVKSVLKKAIHPDATKQLSSIWMQAKEEGSHKYLEIKKITRCKGIRFGKDKVGNDSVIVPYYDIDGNIQTIQTINEQGKYFLKGLPVSGSFFPLKKIQDGKAVYIGEGLATAVTAFQALDEKEVVISAGSAGNISKVVESLRGKYPNIKIHLLLDNNDAALKAKDQIQEPYKYSIPSFEGLQIPKNSEGKDIKTDDFNDLFSVCGQSLGEIRKQILKKEIIKEGKKTLKLQFISEISSNYFSEKPPEKPTLLVYTNNENMDGKKIPFLHKEIVGMIAAEGGRGKTHFCTHLAACVASGVPFLGKFEISLPGASCLILGENNQLDIQRLL